MSAEKTQRANYISEDNIKRHFKECSFFVKIIMVKVMKKLKPKYKVRWKNVFKFLLFVFIIIVASKMIFRGINILIDNRNITKINKKLSNVKINNIVDDENTYKTIDDKDINKFDNYFNYVKLGLLNVDLKNAKKINKNVIGWITINGTEVNYPIIKSKSDYYKNHSLDKKNNINGAIYTNSKTEGLNEDIVIKGNYNRFNILFGTLKNLFKEPWYDDDDNYVIKLYLEDTSSLWQIVSVYKTKDRITRNNLINKSEYDFNTFVTDEDRILTIVADGNQDIVIQAKLIKLHIN